MKNPRPVCPNPACPNHVNPPRGFYRKNGHRRAKHNHQPVPRYQCRHCGKSFCATQGKPIRRQHRPDLNRRVFELAVSGATMRRMILLLGCSKRTVDRKIRYLAKEAKRLHQEYLATVSTSFIMMDELITYLHARPKHLSVAVVIQASTGEVLGFTISRIPTQVTGFDKYDWQDDDTASNIPALLREVGKVVKIGATIMTDAHPSYRKWIRRELPDIEHMPIKSMASKLAQKSDERDPLFMINLAFAKMRNDLARLGRKTWTTTKSIKGLENHLWLWVAWTNKYPLK